MKQLRYLEPHLCALCPATILLSSPKNYWPGAPLEQAQYRAGSICSHCALKIHSETRASLKLDQKAKSESRRFEIERKAELERQKAARNHQKSQVSG